MTSSMLRRQLKNLVQNYSEAEVKVREATSNDPWGPSSTQMADISDLTYNVVACNEIMTMLWKRLKDDRNWRHIHKSLTLLEYLLKTGDDRVLLKMKDNIYIVKALTEYRFVEKDGKDQGSNVREKAKVVLVLMEDDDKLKEERDFAKKTREKTSKASSTDAVKDPSYKPCYVAGASGLPSLDNIPSVADLTASFAARKEERLKQEAEKKEMERRVKEEKADAWGAPSEPKEATDPWGTPARPDTADKEASSDAWGAPPKGDEDPFAAPKTEEDPFAAPKTEEDPFAAPKTEEDPFAAPKDSSDPFSAPKDKKDPFAAPKDPFGAPSSPPKDDASDPFNAPPVSSPQGSADAWGAPASGDPWGDGTSATSPGDNSDGFGDSSKPDSDPWGTATAPGGTDDAWGAPAAPSDSSPLSDPFGDGASKKGDPWGAPSSTPSNGTGKSKTASFLGSVGASLVDLDDLFSSNPKPKQRPLINTFQFPGEVSNAFNYCSAEDISPE
uniref:Epsin 1b n=1 Tax=Sparus aurata TaxID=8175 RepID=A0A671XEW0_SPAAU